MTAFRVFFSRVLALFTKRCTEAQLNDEIQAHLELLAEENMRDGMPVDDARAAARREFGGVEGVKEAYRDQRGWPFVDALAQDVRYALRQLRRNKGFATAAILTLSIGVGANTAIFSVVDTVLVRPVSYPDPDRLVVIYESSP